MRLRLLLILCLILTVLPGTSATAENENGDVNLALNLPYDVVSPVVDTANRFPELYEFEDNGKKLTDGVIGPNYWELHGPWVAYVRQDRRDITIDLGQTQTVRKLSGWFLQDTDSGIYFPQEVEFQVSGNGTAWTTVGSDAPDHTISDRGGFVQEFNVSDLNLLARYVRIKFHTEVFVFMSEFQVWGQTDEQPGAAKPQPSPVNAEPPLGFPKAGSKEVGGKRAEVLIPNGYYPLDWIGKWKADDFIPYVAYVDEAGSIKDYMFDSFQFDPYAAAPEGGNYAYGTANKAEWKYYADQLFQEDKQLGALDQAVSRVNEALGNDQYKIKVVIAIPFPGTIGNWGDGISFNPRDVGQEQSLANRLAAIQWYVEHVTAKWEDAGYANLEFSGFYWLNEHVGYPETPNDMELIKGASEIVHNGGNFTFDWIPYQEAPGYRYWKEMGFDNALLQPNYAFNHRAAEDRMKNTAILAKHYGMGIEMEMHWDMERDDEQGKWARDNYIAYLDAAYQFHYANSFTAWYQNTNSIKVLAESENPEVRAMYDKTYEFIKGTYSPSYRPGAGNHGSINLNPVEVSPVQGYKNKSPHYPEMQYTE